MYLSVRQLILHRILRSIVMYVCFMLRNAIYATQPPRMLRFESHPAQTRRIFCRTFHVVDRTFIDNENDKESRRLLSCGQGLEYMTLLVNAHVLGRPLAAYS